MTRRSLKRNLTVIWMVSLALVVVAIIARFAPNGSGMPVYDLIKDMSLLVFTVVAASLAHTLQRRENFVDALRAEWQGIVQTKSALILYCERPEPSELDYIETFCRLSESIDNMRIVYRNVGETDKLIGLYPYAPLHNMRRALQSIDPRKVPDITAVDRKVVRDMILESFYALRERFLEELDLEEPSEPILVHLSRRLKFSGTTPGARFDQTREQAAQAKLPPYSEELQALITRIEAIEQRENNRERKN